MSPLYIKHYYIVNDVNVPRNSHPTAFISVNRSGHQPGWLRGEQPMGRTVEDGQFLGLYPRSVHRLIHPAWSPNMGVCENRLNPFLPNGYIMITKSLFFYGYFIGKIKPTFSDKLT